MSAEYAALCWDPTPKRPTMAAILDRVAEKYGLTVAELKGQGRSPRLAHPRHEAMHEMYAVGLWSTTVVGKFLGGRDHTTVLHGIRAHAKRSAQP